MTIPVAVRNLILGEGMPKICVPLMGRNLEVLEEEAVKARQAKADLVEWRGDFFEHLFQIEEVEKVFDKLHGKLGQIPILFTIRTSREGGSLQISTKDYVNINQMVSKLGMADLMDIEALTDEEAMRSLILDLSRRVKIIASSHDFEKTGNQEELLHRFQRLKQSGGHILKLAVMPETFADVWSLLEVTKKVKEQIENPVISMSMGETGAASRMLGEISGSCMTFGTVGALSAPGQLPAGELRKMLTWIHNR